jgi:hypothetical protein
MASWKYRFEEIACEVENLESPATVRARELGTLLAQQYIDEANNILKAKIYEHLCVDPSLLNPDACKHLQEQINWHEDIEV